MGLLMAFHCSVKDCAPTEAERRALVECATECADPGNAETN